MSTGRKVMRMPLILLPQELLLIIVETLPEQDLNSLALTCRHLYASLNPVLYNRGLLPNFDYPFRSSTQSSRTWPAVFCAATKGNLGAVRKFITEYGVDVNERLSGSLLTLLHCAASYRHSSLVKFLLENGASLSVKDQPTTTALQRAVQNDDTEIVRSILEYRPDVSDVVGAVGQISHHAVTAPIMVLLRTHILNEFGYTPGSEVAMHRLLLHAIGQNDEEGVRELLDRGAQANFLPEGRANRSLIVYWVDKEDVMRDIDYIPDADIVISALFYAIMLGHLAIAQLLHDYGASIDGGKLTLDVLFAAVWSNNVDALKMIVGWGGDVMVRLNNGTGTNLLQVAAGENLWNFPAPPLPGSLEITKHLIALGVPVDYPDDFGETALHAAVWSTWKAGVRYLLENGADPNVASSDGPTILYSALREGFDDITPILLEYNADIVAAEKSGENPLMCVVRTAANAALLAQRGCDIHARDNDYLAGLDYAIRHGDIEMVRFFLESGASTGEVNGVGVQPLHLAAQNTRLQEMTAIIQCLLEHGAPVSARDYLGFTPLHHALLHPDPTQALEVVKLLLENGADLHSYDGQGSSDFHLALSLEVTSLLPVILNYVVDINQRTRDGQSPLQLARMTREKEAMWMLLDRGADVNMKNRDGEPLILHAMIEFSFQEVSGLLDYGADPMEKVMGGQTLLHIAILRRWIDVVPLLVRRMKFLDDKAGRGFTALHLAAEICHKQTIVLLVEAGANLNTVNDLGETPLQYARRLIAQGANCGAVAEYLEMATQQTLKPSEAS